MRRLLQHCELKQIIQTFALMAFSIVTFGQPNNLLVDVQEKEKEKLTKGVAIIPQNYYKYRADGKPGRGIVVYFNNTKFIW